MTTTLTPPPHTAVDAAPAHTVTRAAGRLASRDPLPAPAMRHVKGNTAPAAGAKGWLDAVTWFLVIILVLVVSALFVVPRAIGGAQLTVLTGSMVPTINPGDVIITKPVKSPGDVHVGDVVTYVTAEADSKVITHRVVSVGANAAGNVYTLRGDANGADDAPITFEQVRGTFVYRVPKAGWAMEFMAQNKLMLGAAAVAVWAAGAAFRSRRGKS